MADQSQRAVLHALHAHARLFGFDLRALRESGAEVRGEEFTRGGLHGAFTTRTGTAASPLETVISTRRLRCRLASVFSFATGKRSPQPTARTRAASTPRSMTASATASARSCDSSRL